MVRILLVAVMSSAATAAHAQAVFHYPPPAPGSVIVSNDVKYGMAGDAVLMMDVHRPAKAAAPLPALIFFNQSVGEQRRASLAAGLPEAIAAGHMTRRNYGAAAAAYAPLVAARPAAARLGLSYGEALLANGQFAAACAALEALKGKGLGPRDLGLPAARACMQSGDAERAIAWLQSIPQRFLPPAVQTEPVFQPLAARSDFQALLKKPA